MEQVDKKKSLCLIDQKKFQELKTYSFQLMNFSKNIMKAKTNKLQVKTKT